MNSVINARMSSMTGISAGDGAFSERGVGVKGLASNFDQGAANGAAGYDGDGKGFALGVDANVTKDWTLGVAAAKTNSDVTAVGQTVKADTLQFGIYGDTQLSEKLGLKFNAITGSTDYTGKRTVLGSIASADYSGKHSGLGIDLDYSLSKSKETQYTALAGIDYSTVSVDSYTETGAGALSLNVQSDSVAEAILSAGVRVDHALTSSMSLTADARLGYDLLDEESTISASFVGGGSVFTTKGTGSDPLLVKAGLGLNMVPGSDKGITARYDIEKRGEFTNQALSLNFEMKF
jgi:uncharacterized protein with beta-barrel porin domain